MAILTIIIAIQTFHYIKPSERLLE